MTANHGGGAVFNKAGGTLTVSNSTIAENSEQTYRGIKNLSTLTLLNTIVGRNWGGSSVSDVSGAVQAGSTDNLISDGTGLTGISNGVAGNQVGTSASPIYPLVAPLSSYGGTTETNALLAGSPAINAGGALTRLTAAITATATTISVGLASAIASTPGSYVIRIESEQMLVKNVNPSTNTLAVTRGYNGTTATTHKVGVGLILPADQIGQARVGALDIGAYELQLARSLSNVGATLVLGSNATVATGAKGTENSTLIVTLASAGSSDQTTIVAGGGVTFSGSTVNFNGAVIGAFTAGICGTQVATLSGGSSSTP